MSKFCTKCGESLDENMKFCTRCGAKFFSASLEAEAALAYKAAGELALPMELAPVMGDSSGAKLLSVLKSGFVGLIRGLKRTRGNKKLLVLVAVLSLIWLLVNLLAVLGIVSLPLQVLSWLTAARGNLIGGSIGKGLVAALLAQIITNKEMLQSVKGGIGQLAAAAKGGVKAYRPLLLGAGAALITCNLMVSSNLQNTMVCIAGFALSARALTQNGFLRRLTSVLIPKSKNAAVTEIMGGWTLGFAIFAAVSLLPGLGNGYWSGILLLAAGGILLAVNKNRKEAAV